MILDVLMATGIVTALSLTGALFLGRYRCLARLEQYIIPAAVGVFLALVLIELIPETLTAAPEWGGVAIGASFILVYILAHMLHVHLHRSHHTHNEKQEAALLVLFGDALHNFADGAVIVGGFLISPEVGWAVTAAVAIHEVPQEIVEFGILIKAGYTRLQALGRNVLSASTVIIGAVVTLWIAEQFTEEMWLITAFVAGNILYIAAAELLPRLHGSHDIYRSFVAVVVSIVLGFAVMSGAIMWSHDHVLPEATHGHEDHEESAEEHTPGRY